MTAPVLTGFPTPASEAEYAAGGAEIEAALRALPGAVAVYRLGSVSVPGISDIDRIAVVERAARVPSVWGALSPRTRELAMHSPFLVDVETFAAHRAFALLVPLALAWGEEVAVAPAQDEARARRLLAAESLLLNLVRSVKKAVTGRVKVRSTLCEMNSIRHGAALAGQEPPALARRVVALREEWFALDPQAQRRRMAELLAEAPATLHAALAGIEAGGPAPAQLAMGPPWANVRLVPADGPFRMPATMRLRSLAGRAGRRPAEAAWRLGRVRLPLPPGALAVLAQAAAPAPGSFEAHRREVAARYREFLSAQPADYAAIGMAQLIRP